MIKQKLLNLGFDNVGTALTGLIPFEPPLIEMCKMNTCGNYGKSYSCPPSVGNTDELIEKAKQYKYITVFQKVYKLEDSFDFEGMTEGKNNFKDLTKKVYPICRECFEAFLLLGAGPCDLCSECGILTDTPCRFPEKAIASLESYAIKVSDLAGLCSMNYINGVNTVTYFGAVLHN